MIPIEEALAIVTANVPPSVTEELPVSESCGRALAEDIIAPEPLPRFTNSAMDGFAVKWEDVSGEADRGKGEGASGREPVRLAIAGESRAGIPFKGEVKSGQAVRVSTGALIPSGADTVVPIEEAEEEDGFVIIHGASKKGRYIRREGEEIVAGERLFAPGFILNPGAVGLLASLGIEAVRVLAPPRVAVIVTGSEIVTGGRQPEPWQIRDSNSTMLSAALDISGAEIVHCKPVRDELRETEVALADALEAAQIVIVSGGVSVGPHDLVKPAAARLGCETLFWRVNQKPGKPLFLARKGNKLLFGLPGNPVATLNCYAYYIHPVIQAMQMRPFRWRKLSAVLDGEAENRGERTLFLRCRIEKRKDRSIAGPLEQQGSHALSSMALADGFILVPPGTILPAGAEVDVHIYPWISIQ
jgi:molybdopterin molybdotransferase